MYGVTSSRGLHPPYRALGPLQQTSPVRVEKLRDGVYRIEWGDGPGAAFAIVNFTRSEFVEDSNPTNPKNVSFDRRDF